MESRIISVTYGHGTRNSDGSLSASGKLYDYETDKKYRVGDTVVVPVQHPKSGKLYNTLAVVRLTTGEDTTKWKQKADNLTDPDKNKKPKNVSQRLEVAKRQGIDVQSDRQVTIATLPGYKARGNNEKWSEGASRLVSRED